MNKKRPTVDGFIPRKSGSNLGDQHQKGADSTSESINRSLHTNFESTTPVGVPRIEKSIGRIDIDESLREIDDGQPVTTRTRADRKSIGVKVKRPVGKIKKFIKFLFIFILVAGLAVGGYMGYKFIMAGGSIFKGSIFDIINNQPLKKDANGRSNFLLLGTSEDDPGHGGAYLTDSMMVVSVDQDKKNVYMFSIPRDLYVEYGMACNSGYSGKINEYFNCVNDDYTSDEAEQKRLTKTQAFVGDIFGLDIQYGVHVNNTVIRDGVDAVDGIDVDIQGSNGAPGILDRNFDWRCNYNCYLVKYDNGVHHLDGEHALFLAMARGDIAPTYGLANSNFDREKNQQKIIIALKDKAASTGTLTNLGKVTSLIDALGKNLRTNIEVKEIRTIMSVAQDLKTENIKTISLFDTENRVVTTGNYNGASVVMPSAGIFDYSKIQDYINKQLSSDPLVLESADVIVLNGSSVSGAAQAAAEKIEAAKLKIADIGNAPGDDANVSTIYVLDTTKVLTLDKLKELYPSAKVSVDVPSNLSGSLGSFIFVVGPDIAVAINN